MMVMMRVVKGREMEGKERVLNIVRVCVCVTVYIFVCSLCVCVYNYVLLRIILPRRKQILW